jgi:membrane protease YdiL (CAAX protease family)
VALLTYIFLYRALEKRQITELSVSGLPRNLLLGMLVGFLFQSLVVLVMYLNGSYKIVAHNSFAAVVPALIISISSGVLEEILCRGIILRIAEEKLGTLWALIISSLLFGGAHLANPGSSVYSALAISIEAGLFLGACYVYSRSLWLPIGLHFAWNFTEGGIYGGPVSGYDIQHSLFTARFSGSQYITGGAFGPENAVQALIIGLLAAVYFLWRAGKNGGIVKPYWKKTLAPQEVIH